MVHCTTDEMGRGVMGVVHLSIFCKVCRTPAGPVEIQFAKDGKSIKMLWVFGALIPIHFLYYYLSSPTLLHAKWDCALNSKQPDAYNSL
jgi:hypothetical protein